VAFTATGVVCIFAQLPPRVLWVEVGLVLVGRGIKILILRSSSDWQDSSFGTNDHHGQITLKVEIMFSDSHSSEKNSRRNSSSTLIINNNNSHDDPGDRHVVNMLRYLDLVNAIINYIIDEGS